MWKRITKKEEALQAAFDEQRRIEALVWSYSDCKLSEICQRLEVAEKELKEMERWYDKAIKELEADNVIMSRQIEDMSVKIRNYEHPDKQIDKNNLPDLSFFMK